MTNLSQASGFVTSIFPLQEQGWQNPSGDIKIEDNLDKITVYFTWILRFSIVSWSTELTPITNIVWLTFAYMFIWVPRQHPIARESKTESRLKPWLCFSVISFYIDWILFWASFALQTVNTSLLIEFNSWAKYQLSANCPAQKKLKFGRSFHFTSATYLLSTLGQGQALQASSYGSFASP